MYVFFTKYCTISIDRSHFIAMKPIPSGFFSTKEELKPIQEDLNMTKIGNVISKKEQRKIEQRLFRTDFFNIVS